MRYIVAGGRDFNNYALLEEVLSEYNMTEADEIVCGGARGADALGELYGRAHGIPIKRMPANWEEYGKAAGFIRNEAMAKYGDFLIAFWDGKSRGTENMIKEMKNRKKNGRVVIYETV